jgi:hypothetical protein
MHARELAETAALVAVHLPQIIQGNKGVPHSSSEQYWAASKCRLDRWGRLLRQLTAAATEAQLPATLAWPRVRPVLEEILVTELLTRLWTAAATAYDAAHGAQDLEPVARSVFTGHLEARRRLLALMADGRVIKLPEAVMLNHLRRRVERWTDMLLAHLSPLTNIEEFAFETGRARDFAEDLDRPAAPSECRFTCQLVLVSLRASFATGLAERSPNHDLNGRIGAAVMDAFRDELIDAPSFGKSLWLERINRAASDTEGMIEELLRLDAGHVASFRK